MVQADLADPDAVRRMVDQAAEGLGGLDVLVNNAGVYAAQPVTEGTYEEWQAAWQDTLAVNLTAAANATWCAVRHMIAAGGGRIINVSSRGAFRGEPDHPAYAASKAGLNAFGQSLGPRRWDRTASRSPSWRPGSWTRTWRPAASPAPAGTRSAGRARSAGSPARRRSPPPWLYLASAEAEWASGAILDLNGASYLRP